jgi:cytochrome c-type biogenesis protein CcmH
MALWFVFALMTTAAVFAVLWPLGRKSRGDREGRETAVYKDQLAEVERDKAAGLIGAQEAEAARVEIGRRLLAASDAETGTTSVSLPFRRVVAVVALAGLPLIAAGFYLELGSPTLGDFPLAARTRSVAPTDRLDKLVAQVEAHLEKNPADGRGWDVLAPVLLKLGRFDDAVRAYRNAVTYNSEKASRHADLGEAIAAAAGGVVTADAKGEFERALKLDPDEAKAHYFIGLAAEQDGRKDEAAKIWRTMLDKAPKDAPWRELVQGALVRVGGPAMPKLSEETVAAAKDMNAGDRDAMIRGMVEGLATRLKTNGDDVEGWLKLVRAYMVLGETDKARTARADARRAVQDPERLRQLNDGLKNLGLDG